MKRCAVMMKFTKRLVGKIVQSYSRARCYDKDFETVVVHNSSVIYYAEIKIAFHYLKNCYAIIG